MSSRRIPELPFTRALALRSIMARTTSWASGVPTATQWLKIRFSWSWALCSWPTFTLENSPKPVEMP